MTKPKNTGTTRSGAQAKPPALNPIFHLSCPSCGAQVQVRSATSVLVVCDYCHSMLLRQIDGRFTDDGKSSQVLEDYSLIQIGTTGRYMSRNFTVIGRLQKEYDRGYWNEWYLLFDNGEGGWLSESGGQYTVTLLREKEFTKGAKFSDTVPDVTLLMYNGQAFIAADVRSAKSLSVKAQGELPFRLDKDEITYAADYRSGRYFLTLDYTDHPPIPVAEDKSKPIAFENVDLRDLIKQGRKDISPQPEAGEPEPNRPELYLGHGVALEDLRCQLLRSEQQILESAGKLRGEVSHLDCPNCGSTLTWYPGVTPYVVCPSCHADVSISTNKAQVLRVHSMRDAQIEAASIKLGEVAKIGGLPWTVIGLMRCQELEADGTTYLKESYANYMPHLEDNPMKLVQSSEWYEYLLYNASGGFRWIVETEEGWEVAAELANWPTRGKGDTMQLAGVSYSKQWEYGSKVLYAAGAFTWRIEPNDISFIADYRGNNSKLTSERYPNEITWSRSNPVSAKDIATWFHRPELADIKKESSGSESGSSTSQILTAVVFTIILLAINLPIIAKLGFDDYLDSMFWGCALLWAPWLIKLNSSDD